MRQIQLLEGWITTGLCEPLLFYDLAESHADKFLSLALSNSVNRAARISAVADGGQISASQTVIDIIKDVVVEQKPEHTFSFDSDSEEEEWIDPNEKRDVLALRRLGFGISELGERKLKGLENRSEEHT